MNPEERATRNAYLRQWRARNPDKAKAHLKRWQEKKAGSTAEYWRRYNREHAPARASAQRKSAVLHREARQDYRAQRMRERRAAERMFSITTGRRSQILEEFPLFSAELLTVYRRFPAR